MYVDELEKMVSKNQGGCEGRCSSAGGVQDKKDEMPLVLEDVLASLAAELQEAKKRRGL